jgi:uncharacterized hydrophobic protein (TIGR00271 family)
MKCKVKTMDSSIKESQAQPQISSTSNKEPPITDEEGEEIAEEAPERKDQFPETEHVQAPTMSSNTVNLDNMKDAVWFLFPDRNQRLSRFFLLIFFASVIATSGIAADSPATVIGAMIVAPLMTPILGTMLSIVLADGPNFLFSFGLVLAGAGLPILIGYLYGLCLNPDSILAENNSQVAGRVEPKLTDLLGALATGAVGSIALVRKDIAGTLPGVAIAISLVPPLCVVGLTLSTEDGKDAVGALLLFATNFCSIILTGVLVMVIYKVHKMGANTRETMFERIVAAGIILCLLAAVAVPLSFTSIRIENERGIESCLENQINEWANPFGWETSIVVAKTSGDKYEAIVLVTGEPPFPQDEDFSEAVAPCDVDELTIRFIPQRVIEL